LNRYLVIFNNNFEYILVRALHHVFKNVTDYYLGSRTSATNITFKAAKSGGRFKTLLSPAGQAVLV